jgi:hypothetical protein
MVNLTNATSLVGSWPDWQTVGHAKNSPVTNGLAYFATASLTKMERFVTLTPRLCSMKLFRAVIISISQ